VKCRPELVKLEIVQLYFHLLALEHDVNELRKDLIEIVQIVQWFVVRAMNIKMLLMQIKMLLMQIQAILLKLAGAMAGSRQRRDANANAWIADNRCRCQEPCRAQRRHSLVPARADWPRICAGAGKGCRESNRCYIYDFLRGLRLRADDRQWFL
ncbi:MAG: hypothetical protein Q9M29_04715, partial [Mariprofundaceae bacterium]|nr:hypothetical protein [Mariprofundaceae bacterium]